MDKTVAALATDGIYRTDHHPAIAKVQPYANCDPREVVDAHVRRLEALRRAGIVERLSEGVWQVPEDFPERGRQYGAQRLGGGVAVEPRSYLPIERQARVINLAGQAIDRRWQGLGQYGGWQREVKDALRERADFLVEQGLAERRGQHVILAATCWRRCASGSW